MNSAQPFWRNVLRESDGTPSSSRLLTASIVAAALGWVTHVVLKTHALPDNLEHITAFVTATSTSLYGVNKITTAVTNVMSNSTANAGLQGTSAPPAGTP